MGRHLAMFRRRRQADPLESALLHWSKKDAFVVRDLVRSVFIGGQTGSGKSSGSGKALMRAIVGHPNTGGLFIASKPEDKDDIERIFSGAGRSGDLYVIEPAGEYRCNILDEELKNGADTRQLTQCMVTIQETLGRASGDGQDPFWKEQNRRQIFNAIEIVKAATGRCDPWDVQRFIGGAASTVEEMADAAWRGGFHARLSRAAYGRSKSAIEQHDCELATQYWTGEIPRLNDRTRSSINAGVMGLLHVFNTGVVRDLIASTTNLSPSVMADRKWILVNMPIVAGDASATVVNCGIKYVVQRQILRRKASPDGATLVIWCDEFQKVANSYDAAFLAECRSHLGCMVVLTQSIHSMYESVGGRAGQHQANALMTNFGHKIIHTLGDSESAEYFSSLLGKRLEAMPGGSDGGYKGMGDELFGDGGFRGSFSQNYQPVLQPGVFLSGLRSGGAGKAVDGIVIRTGEPFSTGDNYLRVAFKQE
ncbi:type IV secretory system conjugative DNA transfer family protein [Singulisphaera sp. PoT]|uniref:type IV secretory system conjugative DNA transfer family protein n=1 Tax=Singulisphaera sp. PoT TaxID=3411797 RepID=UPI003BF49846